MVYKYHENEYGKGYRKLYVKDKVACVLLLFGMMCKSRNIEGSEYPSIALVVWNTMIPLYMKVRNVERVFYTRGEQILKRWINELYLNGYNCAFLIKGLFDHEKLNVTRRLVNIRKFFLCLDSEGLKMYYKIHEDEHGKDPAEGIKTELNPGFLDKSVQWIVGEALICFYSKHETVNVEEVTNVE